MKSASIPFANDHFAPENTVLESLAEKLLDSADLVGSFKNIVMKEEVLSEPPDNVALKESIRKPFPDTLNSKEKRKIYCFSCLGIKEKY